MTEEGRYLYCVINSAEQLCPECTGLDNNNLRTIPIRDIGAVVHSCEAKPYETKDNEKAKEWVLAHGYAIDMATRAFGTVLPFSFNCLIRGNDETVKHWLSSNYGELKGELERFKDKAEYSVQIFYCPDMLAEQIMSPELKAQKEMLKEMSKGAAYLFARKFELNVKDAVSDRLLTLAAEFCSMIKKHVDDMTVEKNSPAPEKYKDVKHVVALSCLVHKDEVEKLGEVLDEINNREGFAVRFTGPWAPFSFVELGKVRR